MKRASIVAALGLTLLPLGSLDRPGEVLAQAGARAQWIWLNEPDPAAPATRYFRKVFTINRPVQQPVDEAVLDLTATHGFTVWVNGAEVGKADDWKRVRAFDVKKHLVHGQNVIAVEARYGKGTSAGLLARLGYVPNGMSKLAVVSDGSWKASKEAAPGWQNVDFKDQGWAAVKVLGPYGSAGPAKSLVWEQGGDDRFSVPQGFRVVPAIKLPDFDKNFSLINMTFDGKGRLLVARERGPIFLCTDPDKDGTLQTVKQFCTQVTNCQGMHWVKDALLLVGDGPQGTGLYRARDTDGDDKTDEVKLLHKFQGGMGEHGPHAIFQGPDGWLYLVVGNHAWVQIGDNIKGGANPRKLADNSPLTRWPHGTMGPDQGQPNTTEDVLLPRLNDSRGHAANILAPGGTIWRLDHEGQNLSLVAAGFRNQYDAAFSPAGELFTFDSDMEWDEALPWYRHVRVCHCPPGADFVWRTGAANTPDYYIDSLPPVAETGRGSPVGVEFYDHNVYPKKYHGSFFMADWAIGVIFAVHLEKDGASYKTKVERFCTGAPMNVTDLEVGPDGALWFTMGGRGTQGGVYRIVYDGKRESPPEDILGQLLRRPQPLAAYSRAWFKDVRDKDELPGGKGSVGRELAKVAADQGATVAHRIRALNLLHEFWHQPEFGLDKLLPTLMADKDADVRAHAVYLAGVRGAKDVPLTRSLKDEDALVRRRACEALIRAGHKVPVEGIWPLLADRDRFVRHAARLVLERIAPSAWAGRIAGEKNDLIAWNAIVALGHVNAATPSAEPIFDRLKIGPPATGDAQALLDYLRTVQMALIHVGKRPESVKAIATQCDALFPHPDWRVNRELAILLTQFQREGILNRPFTEAGSVGQKFLAALEAAKADRQQQIHYMYCLRLLKGWTAEQASALASWYDGTATWKGGHSFTPFLENIFRDLLGNFSPAERAALLTAGEKTPLATLSLAQRLQTDRDPALLPQLAALAGRLGTKGTGPRHAELTQAVEDALTRTAAVKPSPETWPYLVRGLATKNPVARAEAVAALRKLDAIKPKAEDAAPFRALLTGVTSLKSPKDRWETVELLRQWTGRSFGQPRGKPDVELESWARWFGQTFPKEPPLPNVTALKPGPSKYSFNELLSYLEKNPEGMRGDPVRGRAVFEKANCFKCHKYGKEGEGLGPDLTTLSKRFKRADTLEALLFPSKVISDQYRSSLVVTTTGQQLDGLVAVQGDTITVVQSDASKVTLKRDEVERIVASLNSVMPERLLDTLTLREIADLFAFMESEPKQ